MNLVDKRCPNRGCSYGIQSGSYQINGKEDSKKSNANLAQIEIWW